MKISPQRKKECSLGAISDKIDICLVEKKIDLPPLFLKLLNGQAAHIFELAKMGTGLSVFPLRRYISEAHLP